MKLSLKLTTQSVAVALWATRHESVKRISDARPTGKRLQPAASVYIFILILIASFAYPTSAVTLQEVSAPLSTKSRHTRGQSRSGASCRAAPGLSLHRLARFRRGRPRRCSIWPPGRRERSKRICCGSRQFGTDVVQHGCAAFASAWRH
jgi:hypothetical protein